MVQGDPFYQHLHKNIFFSGVPHSATFDFVIFMYLCQWFPTTVPRNTSVPQAGPKCSAKFFEILKFIQKSKFFGRKCSVRDFFGLKCSARNFPGLKCSATQKRLGTTELSN